MIKSVWGDEVLQQTFHFLIKQVISLRVRVLNERKRMIMTRMIKIMREYFSPYQNIKIINHDQRPDSYSRMLI